MTGVRYFPGGVACITSLAVGGTATIDLFAYAALVAELVVAPERRRGLLAERGLTEEAFADVERWYAAHFEATPADCAEFDRVFDAHRERATRDRQLLVNRTAGAADERSGTEAAHADPPAQPVPTGDDLDRTAELGGQIQVLSLPFRAAMPQDSERMAQRPAEGAARPSPIGASAAAADPLGGTVEAAGAVLVSPLPFAGTSSPLAAPDAQAVEASGVAVVTLLPWRGGDGHLRTTLVGKLCVYLQAGAPPVLVPADPIVAFDRLAADRRFIEAASEMAPWTVAASILAYGGPLRFTFHPANGEPVQVTAAHGAPVGRSMSNPERARYAPKTPTRGPDGVLTIPEEVDGRYFVATPPAQQTTTIVGNERVVLEVGHARFDTMLPANVIMVVVDVGGQRRQVTLPFDTLAVSGDRRRIALIGRAALPGEVKLVGHRLAPLRGSASPVAGGSPAQRRPPFAGTADISESVRRAVMPFENRPAPPAPPAPTPPVVEEEPRPRFEASAPAEPPPAPKPAPKPVIAKPKPGAMAKPRIKKR